jgi:D-alanyl-D-alanine carboxypeptidase
MVEPRQFPARRRRPTVPAIVLLAGAALVGVLACQALASSSSTAVALPSGAPRTELPKTSGAPAGPGEPSARVPAETGTPVQDRTAAPGTGGRARLGAADGILPEGTTVFDDDLPGIANLEPDLFAALRDAARIARDGGVAFVVESGWRSPAYQEQLLRQAVTTYGSAAKAARWVATPETSPHVSGDAVDIGSKAAAWLAKHGARYGLCQIYRNEPWHYELRFEALDGGCPPMYADPTDDPRMEP